MVEAVVSERSQWVALSGEVADVRAYGAKGDGQTDDTVAIKAALGTGANVYLPRGTYRITDSLPVRSARRITRPT